MKAEEARRLADANQLSIETILEGIAHRAQSGYYADVTAAVGTDARHELIRMGYKISETLTPEGLPLTKIEWGL